MARLADQLRTGSLILCCACSLLAWSQDRPVDGQNASFAQMSAKERTRLAKQEEQEAAQDAEYLALMAQAEGLFKEQRFDEAMTAYEQARDRRPLNVYPKVKIADLRVLISKRDAALKEAEAARQAAATPEPPPPAPVADPIPPPVTTSPATEAPTPEAVPAPQPPQEIHSDRAPVEAAPTEKPAAISVGQVAAPKASQPKVMEKPVVLAPAPIVEKKEAAPVLPDGVYEERFREGQAIVLQRTCRSGQVVQVYRKVEHSWGRTFYFLDGLAIQERVWTERFGDR